MTLALPRTGVIALYVDLMRERARAAAAAVARAIGAAGFGVVLCPGQESLADIATSNAPLEAASLLVTIGGDGTLLRAAQLAAPLSLPLFGINTGHLGFLTEIEGTEDEIARLPQIFRAGLTIDERMTLDGSVGGERIMAVNDIVIRRTGTAHMTPFGLYVDGREAAHVPADGIVVATPTGSTAYFLSAGGPILAPRLEGFGVIALLPHALFTRPLIVPNTSIVRVVCDGEFARAKVEADGRPVAEIGSGESVEIARHASPVKFARRAPLDFFAVLEDKMRWNAPIKQR